MRYDPRIAALALPAVLACTAAGGSESAWTGSLDTLDNGVVAVTNPATPVWDETTAWAVQEELRIGALEGERPDVFGSVSSLAVDPAGRMWVLEGQAQELRVFDPEGRYLGRLVLPFPLWENVAPVFRNGALYAVTLDELEVPYVVRARIDKP